MTTNTGDGKRRSIKSVETSFEIIEALQELNSARVTELASHLDMSKSTVYHHLSTLRGLDYVSKSGDEYQLSLLFLNLGKQTQDATRIYQHAKDHIDELAETTGEKAHLMTEVGGYGIYIYQARGKQAIGRDLQVGQCDYLHHSAGGKAILAHLPEERVEEIIDRRGLPSLTSHTISDRAELHDELASIRDQGYSLNLEEEVTGVHAIGAPIYGREGDLTAAISVSGPTSRLPEDYLHNEMRELIKNCVNVIEIELHTNE
jgi:DNA-binding IclR family transcriptional regulator